MSKPGLSDQALFMMQIHNRFAAGTLVVAAATLSTLCALALPAAAQQAPAKPGTAPNAATICAPCHGFDGVGRDVEIPNLAGQHSIYLRNQLLAFKDGRRKHPEMRYVARELSEREIEELVVYYSTLLPP
jgi:cytochrome c553